jgi:hypothetical protein
MAMQVENVRGGFTVVELCVVVLVVGALLAATFVVLSGDRRAQRTTKDGTQVRGIHQGLVLFCQSGGDSYVRPSLLDTQSTTIDAPLTAKDTTSHIVSILIYQGFFTPNLWRVARLDLHLGCHHTSAALNGRVVSSGVACGAIDCDRAA